MDVTFLGHSGFLVRLGSAALLFDWSEGELPALGPEVPLLVFASHGHEDHFQPAIFRQQARAWLLGKDIRLSPRNRERWGVSEEIRPRCLSLGGGRTVEPLPGVRVETLTSTDEGVAFLVTAEGRTVFHAGDLNWWHWEGEDAAWNREMALHFREFTAPLRGRRLDLAFLPLDPRLGEAGFWGPKAFLELADIGCVVPMHQWGQSSFTERFLEEYPQFRERTYPLTGPGQRFILP
nr:MBL fold metallo-hydrolase [uncultured Dysosmobacter sp.]